MQFVGLITFYALISAFGLYKIKAADGLQDHALWIGAFFYGSGFLIWLFILRKFPLSISFPIAAGSLIIATQLFGHFLLRETLSSLHLMGVALILGGIALIFARA